MKLVYIAGPFSPTQKQRAEAEELSARYSITIDPMLPDAIRTNISRATDLAVRVAASGDYLPVCPHSNTGDPRFLELHDPAWWYAATLELMRRCDAIALVDGWEESNGACREFIEACELEKLLWVGGGHCCYRLGKTWLQTKAVEALRSRGETP